MLGCLILHSKPDDLTDLRALLTNVYGEKRITHCSLNKSMVKTERLSDITDLSPGVFLLASSQSDEMYQIAVPSRGSTAVTWLNGVITNNEEISEFTGISDKELVAPGFSPSKLLVKLNSAKHPDLNDVEANYAQLIKRRIIDKLEGSWSIMLAYLTMSSRSRIVLASKNKDIYFHLAYKGKYYVLFWSDSESLYDNVKDSGAFVYSMAPLHVDGTLVLHPVYLVSKWRKWRQKYTGEAGPLMAVSILEGYLSRITVKETTVK